MIDVIVIGAGPAGVVAPRRAAELGARTLTTRDELAAWRPMTDQFQYGSWPMLPR